MFYSIILFIIKIILIYETNEQKIMFDWLENNLSQIEKNNEIINETYTNCSWLTYNTMYFKIENLLERYQL